MKEIVDGQRNVLHVAIDKMAPTSKKDDKFNTKDLELECRNALDMVVDAISCFYDDGMGKRLRMKVSQKLDARLENNSRGSVIRKPIDVLPNLSWEPDASLRVFNESLHDAMNLSLGKSKGENAQQGTVNVSASAFLLTRTIQSLAFRCSSRTRSQSTVCPNCSGQRTLLVALPSCTPSRAAAIKKPSSSFTASGNLSRIRCMTRT